METRFPGFADPVLDGQACFRAVLLTLVDAATPLRLAAGAEAAAWVRFHCGCALVEGAAPFVLDPAARLLDLDPGTEEEPERGATLILEVSALDEAPGWRLSGPGIRTAHHLRVRGAPAGFVQDWATSRARFPRGIDVILCAGTSIASLPRTVRIEEA